MAITGGAQGIGKATATALVRKGCRVAIGDIDLELAEKTAAGLGGGTIALPLDVTDRASFEAFLDETERQLGPVDVVINNAGIMPVDPVRRREPRTRSGARSTSTCTASSPAPSWRSSGCSRAAAATSSTSPRRPAKPGVPGIATYSGTKHAVVGMSEAVRGELRGSGVEVACVMPTVVNTDLTSGVGQRWVKPVEAEDVANEIVDAIEVPRFDVFVPRANGALLRMGALMPRRASECVARLMGMDKLMFEVDHGARAAYEERAAKSVPSAKADADEVSDETPTAQRDAA